MTPDMKRRLTVFGAGVAIGTPLAILLFQFASHIQRSEPRETVNVEVVLTTCELEPGDVFEDRCVEKRVVAEQFIPPDAIPSNQVGLWTGKPIQVHLDPGSAVRTVDFNAKK